MLRENDRPNILFLMTDEHRFDLAGFAHNPIVRTPHLDALARDAVIFDSAYTPAPICIPARQAMMAGQLPRNCGVERYGEDLEPGYETFARRFSRFGYRTVAAGKLHHLGVDQAQGWTNLVGMDSNVDPRHIRDSELSTRTHRSKPSKWSQAQEVRSARPGRSSYSWRDEYSVQGAIQYLDEHFLDARYGRATPDVPLLLKVSLVQPHYPYFADPDLLNYYIPRVETYGEQELFDHPVLGGDRHVVREGIEADRGEIVRAVAAYYSMVESADRLFGLVLDKLEEAGQDIDEWTVVFTSDHGEMLGEHGVWEKQRFFEGSVRVPLFIRSPRRFRSRRVAENVSLCDLYATLGELSEIPVPDGLDSRSMVPLMAGRSEDWDNEVVSQFRDNRIMIKRDHLKYQHYGHEGPEVLFDLESDPGETRNYLQDGEYAGAVDRFRVRRAELGFD
ncbi:sulfatase-like hydrolase/transferase [Ruania rhizosphaerae]|uniref:sulfatase-like hydrolase/transferase n=1 Tax=Ruania rhizosphaerae TaxID=1840413 RepID=UPI0023B2754D|nr:sulfatase-like hydrolase/transferase [Ruania rhizosphaerae]